MVRGAIETEVDTKRDRRPGWILGAAVEAHLSILSMCIEKLINLSKAHLICWLGLQLLENLLRLGFSGRAHGEASKAILYGDVVWHLVQAGRSSL